jgi:hypothetical protein
VSDGVAHGTRAPDPLLYQINTRVLLRRRAEELGRAATLDDIPDAELDLRRTQGFDWIYLLGVWRTGEASRRVSRRLPSWRSAFEATLVDLTEDDICGSCFAITAYEVHPVLGGGGALDRFRSRLADRGMRLMLDFVPNHVALDHPWVDRYPERFVTGTDEDLTHRPGEHVRIGDRVLAHGRDPHSGGWPDTLQLDHTDAGVRAAMTDALLAVAERCDGLRCDMAMLVLPEVFERTWGRRPDPFWPPAIDRLRERHPSFVLVAEVYWDLEREMLRQGFDHTYDKGLYDHLRDHDAGGVRGHLGADTGYQHRMVRFLENHDEARAAATFATEVHRPASLATFLTPGILFVHQGQLEGARTHIPLHLCRGPDEPVDSELAAWYARVLGLRGDPVVRHGRWALEAVEPSATPGTSEAVIAWSWRLGTRRLLVVINYGPAPAVCCLRLDDASDRAGRAGGGAGGTTVSITDRLVDEAGTLHGVSPLGDVLQIELPPWGTRALDLQLGSH